METRTSRSRTGWSSEDSQKYEEFLLENLNEILSKRKPQGFFPKMAQKLQGRFNAKQCRSHDQKFQEKVFMKIIRSNEIPLETKAKIDLHLQNQAQLNKFKEVKNVRELKEKCKKPSSFTDLQLIKKT